MCGRALLHFQRPALVGSAVEDVGRRRRMISLPASMLKKSVLVTLQQQVIYYCQSNVESCYKTIPVGYSRCVTQNYPLIQPT